MKINDEPMLDWTVVLRRRPVRVVEGRPEGGYTDVFEIICRDCGDDPGLDDREVSPALQRIRGAFSIAAGLAAYENHIKQHPVRLLAPMQGARIGTRMAMT
jgi:hypothetical protein